MKFIPGKLIPAEQLTKDVSRFWLEIPDATLDYYPGQHVILQIAIDGQMHRRPYALTSSPFIDEPLSIAVKRVKNGLVSNHLSSITNDLEIEFSDAQGFFYADINSEKSQNYYLFAQDIGIAPIFSILKSILHAENLSRVALFYECSSNHEILLKKELDLLESDFTNRLTILYTISGTQLIPRLKSWAGQKGKMTTASVKKFLSEHQLHKSGDAFFISGRESMTAEVRAALDQFQISSASVHSEIFFAGENQESPVYDSDKSVELSVMDTNKKYSGSNQTTILQSLKAQGIDPPFACESGLCGTCAARLIDGQVEMQNSPALHENDINNGWILTCQARPTSAAVTIKFE